MVDYVYSGETHQSTLASSEVLDGAEDAKRLLLTKLKYQLEESEKEAQEYGELASTEESRIVWSQVSEAAADELIFESGVGFSMSLMENGGVRLIISNQEQRRRVTLEVDPIGRTINVRHIEENRIIDRETCSAASVDMALIAKWLRA